MSKPLALIASRCLRLNGFSDRVTVLQKHSRDLVLGVDIPERVDVIVTELVDSGNNVTGIQLLEVYAADMCSSVQVSWANTSWPHCSTPGPTSWRRQTPPRVYLKALSFLMLRPYRPWLSALVHLLLDALCSLLLLLFMRVTVSIRPHLQRNLIRGVDCSMISFRSSRLCPK